MEIVKTIAEKAGITEQQAKMAVDLVASLLKDKLPAGMGNHVDSLLAGNDFSDILAKGMKDDDGKENDLRDVIGGFFK